MQTPWLLIVLLLAVLATTDVYGHGRLLEPPSRGSLWRFKTDPLIAPYASKIKPNYNDNQLFCGGAQTQRRNGGKCGVCGDSYTATNKEHEAGGRYALGIITRYYDVGQVIPVRVQITAAHKGYFEFRMCPWNNPNTPISHKCLNKHLLQLEDGGTKWNLPNQGVGHHNIMVRLPQNVSCSQCVLQWRYRTGNSWGTDGSGKSGLGYGHQEEFYGCSDVAIGVKPFEENPNTTNPAPSRTPKMTRSPRPSRTPRMTTNPRPSRTPRITKSPRPSRTPKMTRSPRPSRTPRMTRSPRPSRTPRMTKSPRPSRTPRTTTSPRPSRTPRTTTSPRPSRRPMPSTTPSRPSPNLNKPAKPLPHQRCRRNDFVTGRHKCWDCNYFYRCVTGFPDPIKMLCPNGTACNRRNGRCEHRYAVRGC